MNHLGICRLVEDARRLREAETLRVGQKPEALRGSAERKSLKHVSAVGPKEPRA